MRRGKVTRSGANNSANRDGYLWTLRVGNALVGLGKYCWAVLMTLNACTLPGARVSRVMGLWKKIRTKPGSNRSCNLCPLETVRAFALPCPERPLSSQESEH